MVPSQDAHTPYHICSHATICVGNDRRRDSVRSMNMVSNDDGMVCVCMDNESSGIVRRFQWHPDVLGLCM